ncbi:MAG: GtrA family protein [Sulfurimonadaceae bacterium]|jgi:putative flippase GtrA
MKKLGTKLFKYGILGILATLIHTGIAFALLHFEGLTLFTANLTGFLSAFIFSYVMQSHFVFQHAISFTKAFKYFVVQAGAFLSAYFLAHFVQTNHYLQTLIIVFALPLLTFIIHSFWTFNTKGSPHAAK